MLKNLLKNIWDLTNRYSSLVLVIFSIYFLSIPIFSLLSIASQSQPLLFYFQKMTPIYLWAGIPLWIFILILEHKFDIHINNIIFNNILTRIIILFLIIMYFKLSFLFYYMHFFL